MKVVTVILIELLFPGLGTSHITCTTKVQSISQCSTPLFSITQCSMHALIGNQQLQTHRLTGMGTQPFEFLRTTPATCPANTCPGMPDATGFHTVLYNAVQCSHNTLFTPLMANQSEELLAAAPCSAALHSMHCVNYRYSLAYMTPSLYPSTLLHNGQLLAAVV